MMTLPDIIVAPLTGSDKLTEHEVKGLHLSLHNYLFDFGQINYVFKFE